MHNNTKQKAIEAGCGSAFQKTLYVGMYSPRPRVLQKVKRNTATNLKFNVDSGTTKKIVDTEKRERERQGEGGRNSGSASDDKSEGAMEAIDNAEQNRPEYIWKARARVRIFGTSVGYSILNTKWNETKLVSPYPEQAGKCCHIFKRILGVLDRYQPPHLPIGSDTKTKYFKETHKGGRKHVGSSSIYRQRIPCHRLPIKDAGPYPYHCATLYAYRRNDLSTIIFIKRLRAIVSVTARVAGIGFIRPTSNNHLPLLRRQLNTRVPLPGLSTPPPTFPSTPAASARTCPFYPADTAALPDSRHPQPLAGRESDSLQWTTSQGATVVATNRGTKRRRAYTNRFRATLGHRGKARWNRRSFAARSRNGLVKIREGRTERLGCTHVAPSCPAPARRNAVHPNPAAAAAVNFTGNTETAQYATMTQLSPDTATHPAYVTKSTGGKPGCRPRKTPDTNTDAYATVPERLGGSVNLDGCRITHLPLGTGAICGRNRPQMVDVRGPNWNATRGRCRARRRTLISYLIFPHVSGCCRYKRVWWGLVRWCAGSGVISGHMAGSHRRRLID